MLIWADNHLLWYWPPFKWKVQSSLAYVRLQTRLLFTLFSEDNGTDGICTAARPDGKVTHLLYAYVAVESLPSRARNLGKSCRKSQEETQSRGNLVPSPACLVTSTRLGTNSVMLISVTSLPHESITQFGHVTSALPSVGNIAITRSMTVESASYTRSRHCIWVHEACVAQ